MRLWGKFTLSCREQRLLNKLHTSSVRHKEGLCDYELHKTRFLLVELNGALGGKLVGALFMSSHSGNGLSKHQTEYRVGGWGEGYRESDAQQLSLQTALFTKEISGYHLGIHIVF